MSKSDNKLFLTIDQGGHASRTLIIDEKGNIIAKASQPISAKKTNHERAEYDADDIITSIRNTINTAFELAQKSAQDQNTDLNIISAGLATQRSNIVCWNKITGKALSPVISWQDHRAQQWCKRFEKNKDFIQQRTGLPLSSHYGAGKLNWCLTHIPEVESARKKQQLAFGPMASFIAFRLLEEKPIVCDPGNASRTQLLDITTLDWCEDLLRLFDIPRQALPQCVKTRSNFGTLKIGETSIPLTIMTGDQCAAFYTRELICKQAALDTLSITLGTGAFIQQPSPQYPHQKNLLNSIVYADKQHTQYSIEATVNGAGSALENIAQKLKLPDYQSQLPEWLKLCNEPPLFLNGIDGLGTPYFIADFDSRFIGNGNKAMKMVGVVESIIFLIMVNMETLKSQNILPQKIIIGGGLSQLDGLCQRLADLSRLTIKRVENTETTCIGLAYLLSESTLELQHDQTLFTSKPNATLLKRYQRWQQAMEGVINE